MTRQGKQINFWIDSSLWDRLNTRAEELGMTRTAYFTRIITKELETHFLSTGSTDTTIDVEGSLLIFRKELEEELERRFQEMKSELLGELQGKIDTTSIPIPSEERKVDGSLYLDSLPNVTKKSVLPVYTILKKSSIPLTRKEIADAMTTSENSIRRPLDRMVNDGVVKRIKNGRSFEYVLTS